jgi:hypothetical protein
MSKKKVRWCEDCEYFHAADSEHNKEHYGYCWGSGFPTEIWETPLGRICDKWKKRKEACK